MIIELVQFSVADIFPVFDRSYQLPPSSSQDEYQKVTLLLLVHVYINQLTA